jgi:hypothetical protein
MLLLHLLGGLTDEEVDIIVAEELDLLANGQEEFPHSRLPAWA